MNLFKELIKSFLLFDIFMKKIVFRLLETICEQFFRKRKTLLAFLGNKWENNWIPNRNTNRFKLFFNKKAKNYLRITK